MRRSLSKTWRSFRNTLKRSRKKEWMNVKWDWNSKKSTPKIQRTTKRKFSCVWSSKPSWTRCMVTTEIWTPSTRGARLILRRLKHWPKRPFQSSRRRSRKILHSISRLLTRSQEWMSSLRRCPAFRGSLVLNLLSSLSLNKGSLNHRMSLILPSTNFKISKRTWQKCVWKLTSYSQPTMAWCQKRVT